MLICRTCKLEKPVELFRPSQKDKPHPQCTSCAKAQAATYRTDEVRAKNRERERLRYQNDPNTQVKAKARAKKQREENPEKVAAYNREYAKRMQDERRAYMREWRAKKPLEQRQAEDRATREKYQPQRQAYMASYYARRYGKGEEVSSEHLTLLHKWQDHCCFYCRKPLESKHTLEHVVPLHRNGTNLPHNVVLACGPCNFSKQNAIFHVEWKPREVAPAPRWYSVYGLKRLAAALLKEGILCSTQEDHLIVGMGEFSKKVFVLSTFWLGWQGSEQIKKIADENPKSLIFFDKEFALRPAAVINVIKAKAHLSTRFMARKMDVVMPSIDEAREFIGTWHAMGFSSGQHYLGLQDAAGWHAMACFKQEEDRYEVSRMAIKDSVAGGVSRILTHFLETAPTQLPLVAFTDRRMGDGESHFPAGFVAAGDTKRTLFYATPEWNGFKARRAFQRRGLEVKADFFDPALPQKDVAKANGIMRVEGLPLLRFERAA